MDPAYGGPSTAIRLGIMMTVTGHTLWQRIKCTLFHRRHWWMDANYTWWEYECRKCKRVFINTGNNPYG